MKHWRIAVCCLTAALAQFAFGGNGQGDKGSADSAAASTSSGTGSASGSKSSGASAPSGRAAAPHGNVSRVAPAVGQPLRRYGALPGTQPQFRNRQPPREMLGYTQRRNVSQPADDTPKAVDRRLRPGGVTFKRGEGHSNRQGRTVQLPNTKRVDFFDALRRCRHERHDCNWWKARFPIIVFVTTGYYYWDAGYWYPAWGYDPAYDYYEYNGPIYTYGNLLPDQVIANVQSALREEGYYTGPINGSLGPATRAALANYQRDYGLVVTGAIDQPTIQALGFE